MNHIYIYFWPMGLFKETIVIGNQSPEEAAVFNGRVQAAGIQPVAPGDANKANTAYFQAGDGTVYDISALITIIHTIVPAL